MSWASRRRTAYVTIFASVCVLLVGIPLAIWIYEPPSCFDGKQNGGETAIDRGGSCMLLDEKMLAPHSIDWARGFPLRTGQYSAAAYIVNPNKNAGVISAPYRFRLYDANNVEVAEREGTTFILPGAVTPVFEAAIETGHRQVARTFFEFTAPLVWERVQDMSGAVHVTNKQISGVDVSPRVVAIAENGSVKTMRKVLFVAIVFDTSGAVMASSETEVPEMRGGASEDITFTWPDPFPRTVGHVDITPLIPPQRAQ